MSSFSEERIEQISRAIRMQDVKDYVSGHQDEFQAYIKSKEERSVEASSNPDRGLTEEVTR